MARLPQVSGQDAVAAFERAGFVIKRRRGSHIVMTKPGFAATLSIPDHRQIKPGTLRSQIRKAGLSVDDFTALLRR
jgi:predicted RNA binding protein YcfA (HicA-like mRNA interferase family)